MNKKPILQTARLKAFAVDDSNRNHVIELYNRPENIEFLAGIDVEKDIELTRQCYENYNGIGAYLLFENDSGNFVGFGGVQCQEPMCDGTLAMVESDIEFVIIIDKKFGGRGYAAEFCTSFFEKFFTELPALAIPARVSEENFSCRKLLKKFGFIENGKTHYHSYDNEFSLLKLDAKSWAGRGAS